ncbi:MAG: RIP metalloprotease RseP [Chloroflexota bacterium]|nr:RIP metalloprotease RseP [Chloroflexota bacterium]
MDLGWLSWLWIVPVLGVLVFVHELGHFVTARMFGIRVDEFGFGFPPRLFGIKRGGVLYSLNAIPVGGFVRIYGENGENANEPYAFGAKPWWQRAIVLSAGSAMNVLLAFLIFALLAMTVGVAVGGRGAVISSVVPDSPAAAAKLQPGDKLRSIAGVPIKTPEDVRTTVGTALDRPVPVVVERGGREITLQVTPSSKRSREQGALGVQTSAEQVIYERQDPLTALRVGARQTFDTVVLFVTGIAALITGRADVGGLAGPVGIAQMTSTVAEQARFVGLLTWTAFLSLNLFFVNMLPLPALDGGRLVFVLLEAIRRKKVAPQKEAVVHAVGMMLLLMFLIVISFFDVRRIVEGNSLLP